MSFLFLLSFLASACFSPTPGTTISGYVYVDKNNNGVRDKNEVGVKGVIISDQVTTTISDDEGYYQFESKNNLGSIFVTQPTGYAIKGLFWKLIPKNQTEFKCDFALNIIAAASKFTFIHASDTHLSEISVNRIQKLRQKSDSIKVAFVLISGDLIKDALRVPEKEASRLYELYVTEINKFSVPVYSVPGNHEVFGIERHNSLVSSNNPLYGKGMYRSYLGPDYYSFNYGGIHFMGINSVDYHDLWYYGHVDSLQLAWMKQDISSISKSMPVVTFNHIPFFSGGLSMWGYQDEEPGSTLLSINGEKIYRHVVDNSIDIMSVFKNNFFALALSGHYHASQQFMIEGVKTRFNQTGAIINPSGLGDIVLPSGFTVYSVENGKIDNGKFVEIR